MVDVFSNCYMILFDKSNNNKNLCPMVSIFNSTTDYKGVVTTNCENNRKKMEFPVQNTVSLRKRFLRRAKTPANQQVWRAFRVLKSIGGFRHKRPTGADFDARAVARTGSGASPSRNSLLATRNSLPPAKLAERETLTAGDGVKNNRNPLFYNEL